MFSHRSQAPRVHPSSFSGSRSDATGVDRRAAEQAIVCRTARNDRFRHAVKARGRVVLANST